MNVDMVLDFVRKREALRLAREAGGPPPWTTDPIMRQYRFCNVRREDDAVTRWVTANMVEPHAEDPDLWFALVVARHFNHPEPLAELVPHLFPYDEKRCLEVMDARHAAKLRTFNGAYMIGTRTAAVPKHRYLIEKVFWPMWMSRDRLRPAAGQSLEEWHATISTFYGMASFLSAQVVADLKRAGPMREAADWWTFASSGPGSRRGLNRILGRDKNKGWREEDWRRAHAELRAACEPILAAEGWSPICAQDYQSIECEIDKYYRVKLGEGRPKSLFRGEELWLDTERAQA